MASSTSLIKALLLSMGLLSATVTVSAQEHGQQTLFGLGRTQHLDTYLSPVTYQGPSLSALHQVTNSLRRNTRVSTQSSIFGQVSTAQNKSKNSDEMGIYLSYDFSMLYHWQQIAPGLTLGAGGQLGTHIGGLYNTRNGNNPAQGYFGIDLAAKVDGTYRFTCLKRTFTLHYEAALPVLGTAFSPRYNQSYYEIFTLGNRDHNFVLTHPFGAPNLRQYLALSIPLRRNSRTALTIGYLSDLQQFRYNNLHQRHQTRAFLIGWTKTIN